MELKKDEAPKKVESTYSEINSVNDALFGNVNMDTMYQTSSYNSSDMNSKKKVEDHIRRLITIDIKDNIDKVS